MSSQSLVAVKIAFYGEIHRVQVDLGSFTLLDLHKLFKDSFQLPEEYILRYIDNEGDTVTISNDNEFIEACRVFLRLNGDSRTLFFSAVCSCRFQDKLTPLVKAVTEITNCVICAANEAIQKAKASEFNEKCRHHYQNTAQCAQHAVKQTGHFIAEHSRQTGKFITVQSRRFSESEMAQKMKVFAEEVKRSVNGCAENNATLEIEPQVTADPSKEEGVESGISVETDIETETESSSVSSQEEWDLVHSPKSVESMDSEQGSVVVSSPKSLESMDTDEETADEEEYIVEEEYDGEYADEVKMIREMLPHLTIEQVLSQLRISRGSIQVAMNELMDM